MGLIKHTLNVRYLLKNLKFLISDTVNQMRTGINLDWLLFLNDQLAVAQGTVPTWVVSEAEGSFIIPNSHAPTPTLLKNLDSKPLKLGK